MMSLNVLEKIACFQNKCNSSRLDGICGQAKGSAEMIAHVVSLKRLKRLWEVAFREYIAKFPKLVSEQRKRRKRLIE